MSVHLSYALITPAKDEEANLPRLAGAIASQTVLPEVWLIVDDGSTDGSLAVVRDLQQRFRWIYLLELPSDHEVTRGGPIVRAFQSRSPEPRARTRRGGQT